MYLKYVIILNAHCAQSHMRYLYMNGHYFIKVDLLIFHHRMHCIALHMPPVFSIKHIIWAISIQIRIKFKLLFSSHNLILCSKHTFTTHSLYSIAGRPQQSVFVFRDTKCECINIDNDQKRQDNNTTTTITITITSEPTWREGRENLIIG